MGALNKTIILALFALATFSSCLNAFEFRVGGPKGWVVPQKNDTKLYNSWASINRFQLGDTLRFKYKRDSVLEVNEEDYKKCNSSHPKLFSNTGNTLIKLDHQGPFYFISGVSGHCEKGQHLIIKVKAPTDHSRSDGSKSSASAPTPLGATMLVVSMFLLSFFASVVV